MWRCVGLVLTDVSEERIASIFGVAKFASEALALAGSCRLSHQWEITSIVYWSRCVDGYIRRVRSAMCGGSIRTEQSERGNVGHMGNQQNGWGVCWVCGKGQRQVAEYCPETAVCRSRVGKIQGYWASNVPVATGLDGERVFATLKMEAIRSSETSVNTRPTQRHIPEDDILPSTYFRNNYLRLYTIINRSTLYTSLSYWHSLHKLHVIKGDINNWRE
jgi:hypothetical protein